MKSSKVTDPAKRRYDDACAAAHAMDLVGERWTLLVMRELMFGPKRFTDLRASLPEISANVLTQRLEGLDAIGAVERLRLPPPAASRVYALTPWGLEIEPVLQALGRWAARSPAHDPTRPFGAASLMLSLRTMLRADHGLAAAIGFRLEGEGFVARLDREGLAVARGDPVAADVVFEGSAAAVAGVVYGGAPLDGSGVTVAGDRALAERFLTLFPLPAKVQAG